MRFRWVRIDSGNIAWRFFHPDYFPAFYDHWRCPTAS
jgi:hypothetical protein